MKNSAEAFNHASHEHSHSGHGKMMAIHTILMLGMVLPMIATAAPAGAATLGDLAVQSLHMVSDMITGLVEHVDVMGDVITNTFSGDIAANTLEAGAMDHGSMMTEHAAAGHTGNHAMASQTAAGHAAHIGAEAQFGQFDQWLQSLSPSELSQIKEEASSVYGMTLKQYHEMNIMNHGSGMMEGMHP